MRKTLIALMVSLFLTACSSNYTFQQEIKVSCENHSYKGLEKQDCSYSNFEKLQ